MPDLRGRYFYSDYCSAFIRSFKGVSGGDAQDVQDHTTALAPGGGLSIDAAVSFGDPDLASADRAPERAVLPHVGPIAAPVAKPRRRKLEVVRLRKLEKRHFNRRRYRLGSDQIPTGEDTR